MKILSRIPPDRYTYKITNSPTEQYSNCKSKNKEKGDENKPLSENKNAIIVFDDILVSSNNKYLDRFFINEGIII